MSVLTDAILANYPQINGHAVEDDEFSARELTTIARTRARFAPVSAFTHVIVRGTVRDEGDPLHRGRGHERIVKRIDGGAGLDATIVRWIALGRTIDAIGEEW